MSLAPTLVNKSGLVLGAAHVEMVANRFNRPVWVPVAVV